MKIVPYEVVSGPERRRPREGRRQGVRAAGDQRDDPAEAEGGRRGVPRRDGHRRGRHRPRLLQQRPARGDEGRRQDRRPQRPAHHQRADRGLARVRARQGGRPDDPRLRPRRRHVRRLRARARRGRLRGEGHERRQPPRRRQLRQGGRRLDGRRVQARPGHRPRRRTRWRSSASTRRPRRRRSSSPRRCRRRSTCRSSPRRRRARSTSTSSSRARS